MPVRQFLLGNPETASDCLLAADDRYVDAEELVVQQRYDAAAYLFGYAVEMWLKVACMRLRGLGPTSQVKAASGPLRTWVAAHAPLIPIPRDGHDLAFFARCVDALRIDANRPLPAAVAVELQARVVNGLHLEWKVDMRYRRLGLTAADAWAALANAWWVKINWLSLT